MPTPTPEEHQRYRLHAEVCKVLTDPKRLMILDALRDADLSVGALAERLGIALPNASQHLAVLRSAGLVDGRRVGATVVYRLAEPAIVDACDVIHRIVERRMGRRATAPVGPAGDDVRGAAASEIHAAPAATRG